MDARLELPDKRLYKDARRLITVQCYYLGSAAVLLYSAFIGVVCLQSSINIDNELGTTNLAVAYATSAIIGITFNSYILRRLGPRRALLLADVMYLIYTLVNLYPKPFVLITGAVCIGIGQVITYSSFFAFLSHYGSKYYQVKQEEARIFQFDSAKIETDAGVYIRRFTGKFFAIMSSYLVIGNLATYAIICLGKTFHDNEVINSQPKNLIPSNISYFTTPVSNNASTTHSIMYCASKQCSYAQKSVENDANNYEITSFTLKLLLFGFYAVLQLLGFFIHLCFIKYPIEIQPLNTDVKLLECAEKNELQINNENTAKIKAKNKNLVLKILKNLVELGKHMLTKQQLLIIPMNLHFGLITAFLFGDFTRSYISCLLSVENVGLVMSFVGAVGILSCIFYEKFSPRLGRACFGLFAFVLEMIILFLSLFWIPTEKTKWIVPCILAVLWAVSDGFRQSNIAATYVEYFPVNGEVAYSAFCVLSALGSALMYLSGRYLCVYHKLYVLIGFSIVGFASFLCAEYLFKSQCDRKKVATKALGDKKMMLQ